MTLAKYVGRCERTLVTAAGTRFCAHENHTRCVQHDSCHQHSSPARHLQRKEQNSIAKLPTGLEIL